MTCYPPPRENCRIVVTGASSGIGEATCRLLRDNGWQVVAVARRRERLERLSAEIGCEYEVCDVTDADAVDAMAQRVFERGAVSGVVINAGGAHGADPVAAGKAEDWEWMYRVNVAGALATTQAFLPHLRANGGDLLYLTSTAAHETYPGGAGYTAAKHAEAMIPETMRLELVGEPVRIFQVCPGMVKTEEFSLNRLGDRERAEAVYAGVEDPLVAADIADVIGYCLSRPPHVVLDRIDVRPRAQATTMVVARSPRP
ncbi:SDR family oxidoreductase [Nanchangia anserum]|uniref:SDR family oxidoreductase n=1 Tax=Nanchangia anserum TaxID=2692125 RepID=A0A8I0KVK1_9ACTO|nr:SDR family oxidoreductase [Nanchangia anserum]MBD3689019.1 SDR family oxidoreductase [Nanchangia anserum]QOX81264.1 SDR family oxidoreductase [Nanchangia anserum]